MAVHPSASLDVASQLGDLLARVQAAIRRSLAGAGISLAQARALSSVDRHESLRLTDLAMLEQVAQPTISAMAARLESAGLLRRRGSPDDGRAVIVELTDAGRASVDSIRRLRSRMLADHLGALPAEELAALEAALPAFTTLVDRLESRTSVGHPV
ncbi:MAG TPA: MarR family transcriptional regulator [Candidatus Dormibacteraeota bacterium]|nr:MarR family transcriptional regulator [Candidatus Dormibacteraeota bacterium]